MGNWGQQTDRGSGHSRRLAVWLLVGLAAAGVSRAQDGDGPQVSYPRHITAQTEAGAPAKPGPEAPNGSQLVSNVFFQTEVSQALADIASQTGTIIVADESVRGFITVEFRETPLEQALRLVLLPGGYVYEQVEPGVYLVVSPDPRGPNFQRIAQTEIVELDYISVDQLKGLLPDIYSRYVKFGEGGTRVVVTAPRMVVDDVIAQIKKLDTPPLQLLIEALVVETTGGVLDEFSVQAQDRRWGGSTATGLLTYTGAAQDILYRVLAMVTTERGSIKATPRIVTQEGREANVKVAVEQWFSLVSGRVGFEYVRLQSIEAAVSLTITPFVAREQREVTCELQPEVGDVTGVGPDNLPIITKRTANTTVRVKDGQVIAVGGLLQEVKRHILRKIPLLGDIPLIGELFRSRREEVEQREVLIFIVPHILGEDGTYQGPLLSERFDLSQVKPGGPAIPEVPAGTTVLEAPAAQALRRQ